MIPDLSNFFVSFPTTNTLKSFSVSIENLMMKIDKLGENIKIHELQYDPAVKKFHVLLRVSDGKEEETTLTILEDNNQLTIHPLSNLKPKSVVTVLQTLIRTLRHYYMTEPTLRIEWMNTHNNILTIKLPSIPDVHQRQESSRHIQDSVSISIPTTRTIDKSILSEKSLLVVDGNSLLHRAYFATSYKKEDSELERDDQGRYIGACKKFFEMLGRYMKQYVTTHLVIAWDNPDETIKTFREKMCPTYKAHRVEKPMPYLLQRERVRGMLDEMNIFQLVDESGEYEADDLIGTICSLWRKNVNGLTYILSNDKDLYQLLDEHTFQLLKISKEEICYSLQDFQKQYGIEPITWIDSKAILGDSSDGYKGCKGVGDKAVFPLLKQYSTLENILNHLSELESTPFKRYIKCFEEGKENSLLSKTLATIVTNIVLPSITDLESDIKLNINNEAKKRIFYELGY